MYAMNEKILVFVKVRLGVGISMPRAMNVDLLDMVDVEEISIILKMKKSANLLVLFSVLVKGWERKILEMHIRIKG